MVRDFFYCCCKIGAFPVNFGKSDQQTTVFLTKPACLYWSKLLFSLKYFGAAYPGGAGGIRNVRFFGKFDMFRFLETPVLRFALLPYYRRICLWIGTC